MFMSPASSAAGASRAPVSLSHPKPHPKSRQRTEWPPERLAQLRTLFDAGLSHALIAARMAVGKGLVSGKIARLGWRRGETAVSLAPFPAVAAAPLIVDPARMKRLEQLGARECHWPTVEDADGVQLFCGCPRPDGASYCAGHKARAHRRPVGWERQAMEAGTRRAPMREGLGWDRFEGPARAAG